jgi:1-acyl-sn-glycerol-3-phosphate acyltransferase
MEDDRLIQRSVTDEIMYELMRLSGQEYVDEYAAVVKLRLAGKTQDATPDPAREAAAASETTELSPGGGAAAAGGDGPEDRPEVPGTA